MPMEKELGLDPKPPLIRFYLTLDSFSALLGSFQILELALLFAGEEFIK